MSEYKSLLEQILGSQIVAYHPILAKWVGGVKAALLLSQMFYYDAKQDKSGDWFAVKMETIEERTGLSNDEQRQARKALLHCGVLEIKRKGVPCKNFYRVDLERLAKLSSPDVENPNIQMLENPISGCTESQYLEVQKPDIIKESFKESFKESLKEKDSSPKNVDGNGRPAKDEYNRIRKHAEDKFYELTHCEPFSDSKTMNKRVWMPIIRICDLVQWREDDVVALLQATFSRMKGLTYDAPDQWEKTARSIVGEAKRGAYKPSYSFESEMQKFMDWSAREVQSGER